MRKRTMVAVMLVLLCSYTFGAGPVNLSAAGVGIAVSDGVGFGAIAAILWPNLPGNWCYAGAGAWAFSPAGVALGAGDGLAWNIAGVAIFLRARAIAAVAGPGPLFALGLGHADPTPEPCLSPFDYESLQAVFPGTSVEIDSITSWTEQQFQDTLDNHPIGPGNPGSDGFAKVKTEFFDDGDSIVFSFVEDSCYLSVEKESLCRYSVGLCINSALLGIGRSFSIDQTGKRSFHGGWSENDVTIDDMPDHLLVNGFDGLNFTVQVPGFTQQDFENMDLVMQTVVTATIEEKCVPSLTEWGMIVLAAMLMISALWVYRSKRKARVTAR
jgi:hypothetical protein